MQKNQFPVRFLKKIGISNRKKPVFEDIYWNIFEKIDKSILTDLNQEFELNMLKGESDLFAKFEHIALTGGANVNDMFKSNKLANIFQIPSYEQLWVDPRSAKDFTPLASKRVISAHYLHGTKIVCDLPVKSFSFIRDPRKLLISALQTDIQIDSNECLDNFWREMEKKLIYILKEFKHANLQLYELATPNSKKKYPYEHGKPGPLINFENLRGTKPSALLDEVEGRLKKELFFIGITENLSESLIILFEKLAIKRINLWTPGLHSFKKFTFEEAPNNIKDLVSNLCLADLEFYRKQKNNLDRLVGESINKKTIYRYVLENKRTDLKFIQGIKERLDLASAVNDVNDLRLIKELNYWIEINQHIGHIIKDYRP